MDLLVRLADLNPRTLIRFDYGKVAKCDVAHRIVIDPTIGTDQYDATVRAAFCMRVLYEHIPCVFAVPCRFDREPIVTVVNEQPAHVNIGPVRMKCIRVGLLAVPFSTIVFKPKKNQKKKQKKTKKEG